MPRKAKRTCTGTSIRTGKPCKASPLKHTDPPRCAAHPIDPDSPRFGSPAQAREAAKTAGRPRKPRLPDLFRELLEKESDVIARPFFRALGYEVEVTEDLGWHLSPLPEGGVKLYGESKDGDIYVSGHDDIGAMMGAARELIDRVYGKPKQSTEISGGIVNRVEHGLDLRNLTEDELAEVTEAAERIERVRSARAEREG